METGIALLLLAAGGYFTLKTRFVQVRRFVPSLLAFFHPGDGESVFPVKVWADFNLNSIPSDFTKGSWEYGGKTITIDFQKAEPL